MLKKEVDVTSVKPRANVSHLLHRLKNEFCQKKKVGKKLVNGICNLKCGLELEIQNRLNFAQKERKKKHK